MPVQIAVRGTLFHPSEWVNIKGRVVDGKGAGLADVVLHYGDRIVQTDSKGSFEFTSVTRSCSLEIEAASMPFAHFPVEGYTQQFTLKGKAQSSGNSMLLERRYSRRGAHKIFKCYRTEESNPLR